MKRILILVLICMIHYSLLSSCTLWGCVGSSVMDGGLLIAKNRDWNEASTTILKIISPKKGFKYLAMYAEGEDGGVKGGINETGLVVFTASASSVKKEDRYSDGKGKIRVILSECRSVEDVLKNPDKYLSGRTQFLMIGDNKELAWIEISPDNKVHIERKSNGTLYHTNHYLCKEFLNFNEQQGESSLKRCNRVSKLLDSKSPMMLDDMIKISNDKHDGPNNSIWRDGSSSGKTRTLMNMSVSIPQKGFPRVYAKLANSSSPEKTGVLILDNDFWNQDGIIEIKE